MAEFDNGIETFVEEVLENRFPGETFKHTIKKTSQGIRFHCPYCGDTYTIGATPRGNMYLRSGRYKCFNGGCGVSTSISSFVRKWANEYNISVEGVNLTEIALSETDNSIYNDLVISKDNTICEYLYDNGMYDGMIDEDRFSFIFGLINVRDLSPESNVFKYLNGRNAFDIPDIYKRVYSDYTDNRIYILNVDDEKHKVLSYATRDIKLKKYIIHPYSDILVHWNPPVTLDKSYVEFLDMISSYFNILNVDIRNEVNIAEGQFDAMFLDNYMAVQGVSKSSFIRKHIDSDKITLFFDNDDAGKTATINELTNSSNAYGFIHWDTILQRLADLNPDRVKEVMAIHDVNELYSFMKKTIGPEFNVKDFNVVLRKYIRRFEKKRLAFNVL